MSLTVDTNHFLSETINVLILKWLLFFLYTLFWAKVYPLISWNFFTEGTLKIQNKIIIL